MNALDILEGAYAKIKGHWARGALAARLNKHDMTFCAAGAIMYFADEDMRGDMEHELEMSQEGYLGDNPEDTELKDFRFEYNDHCLHNLDDEGREASWLLAEAMGFTVGESEYEENENYMGDLWDHDGFVDECENHIISSNDGGDHRLKVYAAFRRAIKTAQRRMSV